MMMPMNMQNLVPIGMAPAHMQPVMMPMNMQNLVPIGMAPNGSLMGMPGVLPGMPMRMQSFQHRVGPGMPTTMQGRMPQMPNLVAISRVAKRPLESSTEAQPEMRPETQLKTPPESKGGQQEAQLDAPEPPDVPGAPDVHDLSYASMWYYEDSSGLQQGPYTSAQMDEWHGAGYLPRSTLVAPSYYGEVPSTMWPIGQLWRTAPDSAFVLAVNAVQEQGTAADDYQEEFFPSDRFIGRR